MVPTSLKGAFGAAQATVDGWGVGWTITSISSSDVNDSPGQSTGADGLRNTWQVEAAGPRRELRWLRISGGVVVDAIAPTTSDAVPANEGRPLDRPILDSTDIVPIVRNARPDLMGADASGGALGLHFAYRYDATLGRPSVVVLGVIGGLAARVWVEPTDGTVLRVQVLSTVGGSAWFSADGGEIWQLSTGFVGAPIRLAAGTTGGLSTLYMASVVIEHIHVSASRDGMGWATVADLPPESGASVRSISVNTATGSLLLSTPTGLWSLSLSSGEAKKESLEGQVTDVASAPDGSDHALVVVQPGMPQQHYVRSGGGWSALAGRTGEHLAVIDGAVREFGQNYGSPGGLPMGTSVAGQGQFLVAATAYRLLHSSDSGATWLSSELGGEWAVLVALSPAFVQDGIALAAALRGAVWRSTDHGATWHKTPGPQGEPGALVFLDGTTAICIERARQTWIDI
jgi:hypothetical protein